MNCTFAGVLMEAGGLEARFFMLILVFFWDLQSLNKFLGILCSRVKCCLWVESVTSQVTPNLLHVLVSLPRCLIQPWGLGALDSQPLLCISGQVTYLITVVLEFPMGPCLSWGVPSDTSVWILGQLRILKIRGRESKCLLSSELNEFRLSFI